MSKECNHCGFNNKDSALKCESCGENFNSAQTTSSQGSKPILTITEKRSGKEIVIDKSGLIGRNGDIAPEFFAEHDRVSREHCRIILENGEYKIEHLSNTNPTIVDGATLVKGIKIVLRNGCSLKIAHLGFCVAICSNEPVIESAFAENATLAASESPEYVIICPNCGFTHNVNNLNETIAECNQCGDDKKRKKIAKEKAVIKDAS